MATARRMYDVKAELLKDGQVVAGTTALASVLSLDRTDITDSYGGEALFYCQRRKIL